MKCKWKYFIVLNNDDRLHNLVEEKFCDELLEWVKVNTDLKAEDGDFKIEGQYLPCSVQ